MSNTADDFAERMKYLANQDFGGTFRPGLVAALANGSTSAQDLNRITGFIKALDLAKVATANQAAGINAETSPENADLLVSIGEDKAVVQRANSTQAASANPQAAGSFLNNTFQTIAEYASNSGDVIFPQSNSFAPGNKAPDGSSNESIWQKTWRGFLTDMSWLGRIPGFLYQATEPVAEEMSAPNNPLNTLMGGDPNKSLIAWGGQTREQAGAKANAAFAQHAVGLIDASKAAGYDGSLADDVAFLWTHGESDFHDLGSVYAAHGKALTDTAVKMFQADAGYGSSAKTWTGNTDFQGALANYQGKLNADLQDGKITPKQYTDELKQLSAPDLQAAYQAVDAQHVSLGRDLANTLVDYDKHPGLFKYISGTGDFAFSLFADPTLVATKTYAGIKAIRYGAESLADESKLSRLYGVADKVTGVIPKLNPVLNAGAYQARRTVTDFLVRNEAIRAAEAEGDKVGAAALLAENARRHPDLMPAYHEAQGWRAAWSPEEIAQARREGTTMTLGGDAIHEAMNPARGGKTPEEIAASVQAFKDGSILAVRNAKPIETLDEWVDYLANKGGLVRWQLGLPIRQARVLPGMMGFAAEARAAMLGRHAYNRVITAADKNSGLFAMLAKGGLDNLAEVNIDRDAGKIIASDEGEAYKTGFLARLTGGVIGGRDSGMWLNFARGLAGKGDATVRRLTTLLPTNHFIAFNSTQSSQDIERFLRTYLPKGEAAFGRYLWDSADTESARRQLGRALVNQVAETSGITRSISGREAMAKWNAAFDDLEHARYGLGDTDLVSDVARGQRRVALNLSQLETHLVLPPFTELRRHAAKAAILGFDKPAGEINSKAMLSWFTKANGDQDVMAGIRRMLASPTASIRYGLFQSGVLTKAFGLLKLGWLGTTSNMLRQYAEEYTGLKLGRHGSDLAEGKRLDRAMGGTTVLVAKAHHLIPHALRPSISTDRDFYNAVTKSRLSISLGDRPLDDVDRRIIENLSNHISQSEVLELLGGRQITQAEGGVEDAIDAHNAGVQMERVGWKSDAEFKGYTEGELNGDAGRKALAASYGSLFLDRDEPARRILAYLMWNEAAKNPKFLAKLDEKTLATMERLVPPDRVTGMPLYRVHETGASALPSERPQGLYMSHEAPDFASPHIDSYDDEAIDEVRKEAVYQPGDKEVLTTPPHVLNIQGLIGPDKHVLEVDAGNAALKELTPKDEYQRLITQARYGKDSFAKYLAKKYPDVDWTKFHNSYEQLMTLGAMRAKAAGYKAIWHKDINPNFNEYVALTDDAIRDRGTGPLLGASTTSIKDYVKSAPEMGTFRQRAEILKHDETGHPIPAGDESALNDAIERYVHSQVYNVANHVFDRSGKRLVDSGLLSNLLHGKTPSELELSKIPLKGLPEHVIRAEYAPAATSTVDKIAEKITQASAMGSKAFDAVVTKPMQRLERKPLFYGNYARAYRELQPYREDMIKAGFPVESADAVVDRMSLGRALQNTIKYLDNPKVASQASAVAQNFWLFARAQEDFIRRWVGIVKERPETLRLAHMAVLGAVHSGMLYRDSDGNLTLSYPGSGAIIDAFLMAQRGLGIANDSGVKVPSAHDLTTQLNYLNPSLMNPAGFSATPMVTLPWDMLKTAIPGAGMLKADVDMAFNGQLGNGRSWWEQFMPTEINRIIQLQGENNDTGSQVGGAAATAILHASLAGQLNDATDDVTRQHKIADLKTMTLTAMYVRALFAYGAPGATSMPELDYRDSKGNFIGDPQADLSWRAMGIKNMSDEYKAMIQAFGVDKGLAVWLDLHPDLLPYTVGKTTVGAASANADPTQGATQWIMDNKELFKGPYARVAAYFIPPAPGTFDQIGWNAMTEIGVRQHKDLNQYYIDIATKNAVSSWFAAKDKYEPLIAKMAASGQRTKDVEDEYNKVKTDLKVEYPILDSYFQNFGQRANARTQMLGELRTMVTDPSVKLPDMAGLAKMFEVLDIYNAKVADLKGQQSNWAASQRQDLTASYEGNMAEIIKKYPNLNDVYNGVFREMEQ